MDAVGKASRCNDFQHGAMPSCVCGVGASIGPGQLLIKVSGACNAMEGLGPLTRCIAYGKSWLESLVPHGLQPPQADRCIARSGIVVAVGYAVPGFHIGDAVIAVSDQQMPHDAGYCVAEAGQPIARIPAGLPVPDIMALTKGAALAMRFLRTAPTAQPSQVMIFGADSDMGAVSVQLAKATGAEVTAVTHSVKLWAVAALGADSVLDVAKMAALDLSNSFDVLFDCTATLSNRQARKLLANRGRFAVIGGGNGKSSRATRPADMRQIH